MSARKFTMQQVTDRVLDSDFDPGEATQESQDEGDTSTHESQDEADNSGDTNILARRENTDYVDRVIRKDAAVWVKAHRCGHGKHDHDSDSSFDHSSEFEKDKTSPPQTLQELRGKKRARSVSPPAHASANVTAESPVPGTSLVRTSTPNGPGAVTATFGSGSRSHDSLDDTIEGFVDVGDLSDSDVIIMGEQPVPQDATSGDSDSDTMDAEDLNRCMRSQSPDDTRANDEDNAPDVQDRGHQRFMYSESFGLDQEGQEGDTERNGMARTDDDPNNDDDPPSPPPLTEGPGGTGKWAPASKNRSKTLWIPTILRMWVSGSRLQHTPWAMSSGMIWCSPDPPLPIALMGYCSTPQECPPLNFSTRCGLATCSTTSQRRQTITTTDARLRVTTIDSVSLISLLIILVKRVHIYVHFCLWH